MKKTINIRNKKDAITALQDFQEKQYTCDVRFTNVHLKELNTLVHLELFTKNDLFVEAGTLWDLMQPLGDERLHHFHALTPTDIYETLRNITHPYCVLENSEGRIEILSSIESHFGVPLIVVIELKSGLIVEDSANINKMVTMFPKRNADQYISKFEIKKVFYLNKGNLKTK